VLEYFLVVNYKSFLEGQLRGALSRIFLCLGVKIRLNQNYVHFITHKVVLELQEEDLDVIEVSSLKKNKI